jgi:TM2 domain-containing membrane protein YozV
MNRKSTFRFFSIAGLIGSFKIVGEKGWLYLIPFWIGIILISLFMDYVLKRWKL